MSAARISSTSRKRKMGQLRLGSGVIGELALSLRRPVLLASACGEPSVCGTSPVPSFGEPFGKVTVRLRVIRTSPVPRRSEDRKSTRLNSSHGYISYAVFCLKKKNNTHTTLGEIRAH